MTSSKGPSGFRIVAIDGGAASGKSSTSRELAIRLNLMHVDTGSHYRAVTHACLANGFPPQENADLQRFLGSLSFSTVLNGHAACMSIDGQPVLSDSELRSPEINAMVSPFSAVPPVRQAVKASQR